MKESEKLLEKKLGELIKKENGWSIKLPAIHIAGIPDRICLLPMGKMFFAEIKTTGEKPTKVQLFIHRKLAKIGFTVEVLDSTEKIKETIARYVAQD